MCFKGLVNGRRHMHPSGDRFKVVNTEGIWIYITVPPDQIERMMHIMIRIHDALLLDVEEEVAGLIMRLQVDRQLDVTLTEWRMFQQLPHLVHIPLREVDRRKTLHYKQAVVLIVEMELINSSSGYDDIIAVFKAHFTISTQSLPLPSCMKIISSASVFL